jgi:hypothetical protein
MLSQIRYPIRDDAQNRDRYGPVGVQKMLIATVWAKILVVALLVSPVVAGDGPWQSTGRLDTLIAFYCHAPGRRGDGQMFCCDRRVLTGARTGGTLNECQSACGPRLKRGDCKAIELTEQDREKACEKIRKALDDDRAFRGAFGNTEGQCSTC